MSENHLSSSSDEEEAEDAEESILFPKKVKQEKPASDVSSEEESLLVNSDSDEAPEDVGFSESRRTAMQRIRRTLEQIKNKKLEEKAKRRQRDELYKQQKLELLKKSKLPEDFLKELSDELSPPKKVKSLPEVRAKTDAERSDHTEDVIRVKDEVKSDEDFLPFIQSRSIVEAVALSDYVKQQPKSAAEKAAEFRKGLLYGNKVPRESVRDMQSKQIKRLARYK